jgi:hypothetical protein
MERKWNQEKALRDVAETRVKALKKKVRAYESMTQANMAGAGNPNDISIDGVTVTTTGAMTRDDESVGTYQTHEKQQIQPPLQQPPTE